MEKNDDDEDNEENSNNKQNNDNVEEDENNDENNDNRQIRDDDDDNRQIRDDDDDEENDDNRNNEIRIIRADENEENKTKEKYNLDGFEVEAIWSQDKDNINILFKKSIPSGRLILHWGIYKNYPINEWHHPNKENYPKATKEFDGYALETEFIEEGEESKIELNLRKNDFKGLSFVFYNPNQDVWYNNCQKDFQIQFIH